MIDGSRAIETGDASLLIVGGVESVSSAPWVADKPRRSFPRDDARMRSTTIGWRMVNPRMLDRWTVSLGEASESLGHPYQTSREDQDRFALRSQHRALESWNRGSRNDHIVTVGPPWDQRQFASELTVDESIRLDTSLISLAGLALAFTSDGAITAGNSGSNRSLASPDVEWPLSTRTSRARAGARRCSPVPRRSNDCDRNWIPPQRIRSSAGRRPRHVAARQRHAVGAASLCIGVGQGAAVVLGSLCTPR